MALSGARLAALAVATVVACGGGDAGAPSDEAPADGEATDLARPPSAGAPRAGAAGEGPDTMRPGADTLGAGTFRGQAGVEGRRRSPEEFDLARIVADYRRYYIETYLEQGSSVQGRIDPELESHAKRRVALDWGYVDVGAWSALVADLSRDQRIVLDDRLAAVNAELVAQYHGGEPR